MFLPHTGVGWYLEPAFDVKTISRRGAFISTLIAFFVAEIGDKTQIVPVGLAARFENFYLPVIGTTLGMRMANIPAVLLGDKMAASCR